MITFTFTTVIQILNTLIFGIFYSYYGVVPRHSSTFVTPLHLYSFNVFQRVSYKNVSYIYIIGIYIYIYIYVQFIHEHFL